MKKLYLAIIGMVLCLTTEAQEHSTRIAIDYLLHDDLAWLRRHEGDMQRFREHDMAVKDFSLDAMFVGSSSIMMWKTVAEDFPNMNVLNRGYGGSTIRDILYNYATVFGAYKPSNIVFYCDNDISGDPKRDVSMGEWYDLYRVIFDRIHQDYPSAKIYALCIKYSDDRLAIRHIEKMMNSLMEEYCAQREWMAYVDVNTPLLLPDGTPDPKLFMPDGLHVTREAYGIWADALRQAGLRATRQ